MKKYFGFRISFGASLCIVYILSSCAATITITGSNTTTQELTLVDSQGNPASVFEVDAGKSVKWKIAKGSNVSSIIAMKEKDGSYNIFKKELHKKFLSRSWKGTVENIEGLTGKDTTGGYYKEDYYIKWKDSNNNSYTYDPRIQVKSR